MFVPINKDDVGALLLKTEHHRSRLSADHYMEGVQMSVDTAQLPAIQRYAGFEHGKHTYQVQLVLVKL